MKLGGIMYVQPVYTRTSTSVFIYMACIDQSGVYIFISHPIYTGEQLVSTTFIKHCTLFLHSSHSGYTQFGP